MRHIMLATDGWRGADRAVDVAAELARQRPVLSIVTVAGNFWAKKRETWHAPRKISAMRWKRFRCKSSRRLKNVHSAWA